MENEPVPSSCGCTCAFFIISSVVLAEEMDQLHLYNEEYGNINN